MANAQPAIRNKEQDWTEKEIEKLKKLFPTTDNHVIAEKLGRSVRSVRGKAFHLRLKKSTRYWDKPEEDFLLKNWQVMSAVEIGDKIGKTRWAVINKYREIQGLR